LAFEGSYKSLAADRVSVLLKRWVDDSAFLDKPSEKRSVVVSFPLLSSAGAAGAAANEFVRQFSLRAIVQLALQVILPGASPDSLGNKWFRQRWTAGPERLARPVKWPDREPHSSARITPGRCCSSESAASDGSCDLPRLLSSKHSCFVTLRLRWRLQGLAPASLSVCALPTSRPS